MAAVSTKKVVAAKKPETASRGQTRFRASHINISIVFTVALALRLIYFFQIRECPLFQVPTIDAKAYYDQALHFAHGDWTFPQWKPYWQPPFYPAVLAVLSYLVGHTVAALKISQFVLASINCVLVYLLGAKVFDRRIGLIAGLAAALYGPMIYFDGELLTPTVQIFLNLCSILLLLLAVDKRSILIPAISGLIFGLSIITRPDVILFLAFAALWLILNLRKNVISWRPLLACILFVILAVAPIIPVAARNARVGHDNVLISHNGGINFYIGNNKDAANTENIRPGPHWEALIALPQDEDPTLKPSQQSAYFYGKAFDFITSQPGAYVKLLIRKTVIYFTAVEGRRNHDPYFLRNYSPVYSALIFKIGSFAFPFGIVLPLALFGLLRAARSHDTRLLSLYLLSQFIATVAFFVCSRYRMTAAPVFLIFAAVGAMELGKIAKAKQWRQTAMPLAITAIALIFANANIYSIDTNRNWIDAETHYYIGRVYTERGEHKKAVAAYKKAISLDPKYQDSYMYQAISLAQLKRYDEARSQATYGLKLYPTSQAANEKCGDVLMESGDLWGAYHCYATADVLHPWSFSQLHHLKNKANEKQDFLLVLRCLEAMVKQRPDVKEARYHYERVRSAFDKLITAQKSK